MKRIIFGLVFVTIIFTFSTCRKDSGEGTKPKVVFIGLDGVTWPVLQALTDSNAAPVLRGLMDRGVHGTLVTKGQGSPSKWTTMATGVSPKKHGILGFQILEDTTLVPIKSYHRQVKALWNWCTDFGKTVGVINYLVSWPAEKVNGYVVTRHKQDQTYPPALDISYEKLPLERMPIPLTCDPDKQKSYNVLFERLHSVFSLSSTLRKRYPTDLFIAYTHSTDEIGHRFWKYHNPESFDESFWNLSPDGIDCFEKVIPQFYQAADTMVGHILEGLGDDTIILIASDHGMGPKSIDQVNPFFVYNRLYQYLAMQHKNDDDTLVEAEINLISVDPSRYDTVEWAKLILPEGADETDRAEILKKIARTLRNLTLEPTGEKLFRRVHVRGPGSKKYPNAPEGWDIRVVENKVTNRTADKFTITLNNELHELSEFVWQNDISGTHVPEGIFIAAGPGIRRSSEKLQLRGIDMTPTILHMLDLPVPERLEGKVMSDIFEPEWFAQNRVRFISDGELKSNTSESGKPHTSLNKDEEKAEMENLRALGYIE